MLDQNTIFTIPLLFIEVFNKKKVVVQKKVQFSRTDFLLDHDQFLVDKLGPFVGKDFFQFFSSLFHFLHGTLNLAYFAPLNGADRIFPVNFNYQRCLENSNMIRFWLTRWVPSWGQIFLSLFSSLFAPDKSGQQTTPNKCQTKILFLQSSYIFGHQSQKLIDIWPPFCSQKLLTRRKLWFRKKFSFPGQIFCLFPGKKHVVPMFYQYCVYIFLNFFTNSALWAELVQQSTCVFVCFRLVPFSCNFFAWSDWCRACLVRGLVRS